MKVTVLPPPAPRNAFEKVNVKVSFSDEKPYFSSSAVVDVFIGQTESLAQMQKQAISAALTFLRTVVDRAIDE